MDTKGRILHFPTSINLTTYSRCSIAEDNVSKFMEEHLSVRLAWLVVWDFPESTHTLKQKHI